MDTAPILLFVYNRPAHTRQALEALSRNTLSADSDLFIYSDAARSEADRAAVEEVRRIVREAKGSGKYTSRNGNRTGGWQGTS